MCVFVGEGGNLLHVDGTAPRACGDENRGFLFTVAMWLLMLQSAHPPTPSHVQASDVIPSLRAAKGTTSGEASGEVVEVRYV